MGGGKGGGGCQLVGYGYTLTMLYAFCERADKVSGWKVNDKIWWRDDSILTDDNTYQTSTQNLYTGKKGDVYHSDGSDHTDITFYLADYIPISYPQNNIGYDIKLNNITFSYMENAFVGDNTTTVPRYTARLSRFFINGQNHRVGTGSINPIAVIREIMQEFLSISQLNDASFNDAYNTCSQEGLGVAFVMTTEKKVKDWLKEILRTIDGVMWFDTLIGEWKIKLFRPDYDTSSIFEISEENTSKLEITSGSWDSLVNDFTFKYTDIITGKPNSFSVGNSALFNILGYKVSKVYTYQLIGEYTIMAKVASRVIKKNSKPLAQLKTRISIVDLPYIELGGVVKVTSTKLDIDTQYFRITKIGGDKEDDVYVDIEAMEEIWDVEYTGEIVGRPLEPPPPLKEYAIDHSKPYIVSIKELPNTFVGTYRGLEQPIGSVVTYPKNYDGQYLIDGEQSTYTYPKSKVNNIKPQIYYFGKLQDTFNSTGLDVNIDQNITIKPYSSDNYCVFPTITQTDEEWQQLHWLLFIDNEIFGIKNITTLNELDHTYSIDGIIRLMDRQKWGSYDVDTPVYLRFVNNVKDLYEFAVQLGNPTINLSANFYNYITQSEVNTDTKNLVGDGRKLIPPYHYYMYQKYVPNEHNYPIYDTYLVFSKTARGLNTNATFENIEDIKAGEKENVSEATHIEIRFLVVYSTTDEDGTIYTVYECVKRVVSLDDPSKINSDENGLITINVTQNLEPFTIPGTTNPPTPPVKCNIGNIQKLRFLYKSGKHTLLESDYVYLSWTDICRIYPDGGRVLAQTQ